MIPSKSRNESAFSIPLRKRVVGVVACLAFVLAGTSWSAQDPMDPVEADSRWQPWLGCWHLVAEKVDSEDQSKVAEALVCLAPRNEGPGVEVTTLADGDVVLEETFIANGERNPVEEPGCQGWQSAEWSRDGRRLFLYSEMQCEGEGSRSVSGVSLMMPPATWLNIQMIRAGDLREIVIRRYVPADADRLAEAGLERGPVDDLDTLMARLDASGPLKMTHVVEAIDKIDPEVVEAAIVETEARFDIDSKALVGLASYEVPPDIIDLMVAMSFPERFQVGRRGRVSEQRAGAGGGGTGSDLLGLGDTLYPYWSPTSYWNPYSYWNPFYVAAPFGYYSYYNSPYFWGQHYVLTRSVGVADSGGKVVKGQGYTRIQPLSSSSSRGGGGFRQTGRSDSGSVGSGGYSSGGGGSGRTAKPKKN